MKFAVKRRDTVKKFISEIDIFLAEFDENNPNKSQSQEQEIEKYKTVFAKRDKKSE